MQSDGWNNGPSRGRTSVALPPGGIDRPSCRNCSPPVITSTCTYPKAVRFLHAVMRPLTKTALTKTLLCRYLPGVSSEAASLGMLDCFLPHDCMAEARYSLARRRKSLMRTRRFPCSIAIRVVRPGSVAGEAFAWLMPAASRATCNRSPRSVRCVGMESGRTLVSGLRRKAAVK
jgi:hypothetical protein